MKSTIKIFAVFAMVVGFAVGAKAQTSKAVKASATVQETVTLTPTEVQFGNVQKGTITDVYLDPKGTSHTNIGTVHQVGKLEISGSNNSQLSITWPSSDIQLKNASNDVLHYKVVVNGYNADTPASSSVITTGTGNATLSASGKYFLFIGGYLGTNSGDQKIGSGQATGTYESSDLTFTVEYN